MWDKDPVSLIDDVVLKDGAKHIKNIATDMANGIYDLSPVDTSEFISNTNITIGEPDYSHNPAKRLGRGGARAQGMSVINSLPDDRLFSLSIANGTPHGKYLEGGWSKQAPNGVYTVTFLAVSMWYR